MSDTTDDLEFHNALCFGDNSNLESLWEEGVHVDRKGNKYNIFKMEDKHLLNTINYFEGSADTSILKREARRRDILPL